MTAIQLRAGDGCDLHGIRLPPPSDAAPSVLLLHTANQTHRTMLPLAEALRDVAEVTALDLRGHGASHCPDPAAHTWDRLAEDVLDWVRSVRASRGAAVEVLVAGFALGASVAVRAAANADRDGSARIDALAVLAPHHRPGEQVTEEAAARNRGLADKIEQGGPVAVLEPWLRSLPDRLAEPLRRDIALADPASLVASFRGLTSDNPFADEDTVVLAGRHTDRILVVPGDDASHPAEAGEALAELFAKAGAAQVEVADVLAGVAQPSAEQWSAAVAGPLRATLSATLPAPLSTPVAEPLADPTAPPTNGATPMSHPTAPSGAAALDQVLSSTKHNTGLFWGTLTVLRVQSLTRSMRRVVLGGPDVDVLDREAANQAVRLFLPDPAWARDYQPSLEEQRPLARVYTVRELRLEQREIDLDIVLHEAGGPGMRWLERIEPGDRVPFAGPRVHAQPNAEVDAAVLAGDDSALPAIAAILAAAGPGTPTHAVIEVDGPEDEQPLVVPEGSTLRWAHRTGGKYGPALTEALEQLPWPAGNVEFWVAGELWVVRALRAWATGQRGLPRRQTHAYAYWRLGSTGIELDMDRARHSVATNTPPGAVTPDPDAPDEIDTLTTADRA
jgi:NADPH-dependent ferric siderophore reductase/pimeloyl-ACP methyl ester carboxylesterase